MTDELIERLRGGKCPRCEGWGEVSYFGQMVACECLGKYEAPISMETRKKAADTLASQARQIEALREVANELVDKLWVLRCNSKDEGDRATADATIESWENMARATLKETSRAN